MKIKIKNFELLSALNNLSKVIPSKSIEPILENVLIRIDDNGITLTATNLEQGMKILLHGEIIQKDEMFLETVLPFNYFKEIISKFNNSQDTEIDINIKKAILKQDNSVYSLNCFNPDSFAILPEVEGKTSFKINFNELKSLIENTVFAASKKDESRKEFKGVLIDSKSNEIRFVSTDSTALALNKFPYEVPEISIIVPWKTMDILNKIDIKSEEVEVVIDDNTIKFNFPEISFISLLINGKFPAYEGVIPESFEYKAEVKKAELLEALKRVNILASKGNERINITFSDGSMMIESVASEIGEGKEKLTCDSNAEITLCFYCEKLISGVEHVKDESVHFGINGPLHPVLIKGVNNDSYLYVIMPQKSIE